MQRLEVICYGRTDCDEWAFGVRSESDPAIVYDVALWPNRELAVCSCMDWSCRKRNGGLSDTCKHVRRVLQWISDAEQEVHLMAEVSCMDYLPQGWVIVDEEKWGMAVVMHKAPATLRDRIKHVSEELALAQYGVKKEEEK